MKVLKTSASAAHHPHPVWCHRCCIRIAPYDVKTVFRGKNYHRGCYAKISSVAAKSGKN